jgi:hypothetical protein
LSPGKSAWREQHPTTRQPTGHQDECPAHPTADFHRRSLDSRIAAADIEKRTRKQQFCDPGTRVPERWREIAGLFVACDGAEAVPDPDPRNEVRAGEFAPMSATCPSIQMQLCGRTELMRGVNRSR